MLPLPLCGDGDVLTTVGSTGPLGSVHGDDEVRGRVGPTTSTETGIVEGSLARRALGEGKGGGASDGEGNSARTLEAIIVKRGLGKGPWVRWSGLRSVDEERIWTGSDGWAYMDPEGSDGLASGLCCTDREASTVFLAFAERTRGSMKGLSLYHWRAKRLYGEQTIP